MKKHFLLLILSLLFLPLAQGKVKLPAMMGDHMVLQQNSSVKLWGWADGKKVTVTTSWNNRTYQASTDKDGAWLVKVDTPRRLYTLFYYNQRWDSGHSLGYTDRGGVDLLRTVEHGNAHDGKCRTAH